MTLAEQLIEKYGFVRYEIPEGRFKNPDWSTNEKYMLGWYGWHLFEKEGKVYFIADLNHEYTKDIAHIVSVEHFEQLIDALGIIMD